MTRKDYVQIATAVRNARLGVDNPAVQAGVNRVMYELADALNENNPRFDKPRFIDACGTFEGVQNA